MAFLSGLFLVILTGAYVLTCLFMIVVVLMQEGKGGGLSGLVSGSSPLSDTLGAHDAEATLKNWTKYSAVGFMTMAILLTLVGPRLMVNEGDAAINDLDDTAPTAVQAPAPDATPIPVPVSAPISE